MCILEPTRRAVNETLAIIKDPIRYGDREEDLLFFSYGIVTFDRDRHDGVDEIIRDADEQMYLFKRNRP